MGYAVRQSLGFARAGAGLNQQRPLGRLDRPALFRIQSSKQVL